MFSKTCEYGIRATIFISLNSKENKRVNLKEIASAIDSPEAFTAKILHTLAKNNIINSLKGPTGGFVMEEGKASTTYLVDIVNAIDGKGVYESCGLGLTDCDDSKPCPVHFKFKTVRENLKEMLQTTSIESLGKSLNKGNSFLKL